MGGSWKLEAFKMMIYMMFPVGCFYAFNQPSFFENWMMEKRKLLFTAENPEDRRRLQDVIEMMELERQNKLEERLKNDINAHR